MPDVDLYDRHPINAPQILEAVAKAGRDMSALKPADLRPHDLDHYGGESATLALAAALNLKPGALVADVCAGMSGPARLIADTRNDVKVIALDYNFSRCAGAAELNRRVGMADRVMVARCDAQQMPLARNVLGGAISQEALLHIPDKEAVLAGVKYALKPRARFAFTDLVTKPDLSDEDIQKLSTNGMQFYNLFSQQDYLDTARALGFTVVKADDLSDAWIEILTQRLDMYAEMGASTERVHGSQAHEQYMAPYRHFVELVQRGHLGGMRLVIEKSGI